MLVPMYIVFENKNNISTYYPNLLSSIFITIRHLNVRLINSIYQKTELVTICKEVDSIKKTLSSFNGNFFT